MPSVPDLGVFLALFCWCRSGSDIKALPVQWPEMSFAFFQAQGKQ